MRGVPAPAPPVRSLRGLVVLALVAAVLAGLSAAPASALAPERFVGLQSWDDPSSSRFHRLARGGVKTWRSGVRWSRVEERRGRYNWRRYDRLFANAAANGIRILPVLSGSPRWASARTQYPPKDWTTMKAFFAFTKAAVRRYGPHGTFWRNKPYPRHVRAVWWQVWNEPNLPNYWYGRVNPPAYGQFLRRTSQAANDQDPDVRIVSAGLPQTSCTAGPCIDDFLRSMYTVAGVGKAIDAVAVHAYTDDYRGIFYRIGLARDQTRRSLGVYKPVMVTEFGWATGGRHRSFSTTYAGQAQRLGDAYRQMIANRRRYGLLAAFWFGYRDRGDSSDTWQWNTGLFERDWDAKPAWRELVEITGGKP